jgi:DNA-directed RNA polymerase specialized sigma24 family protein
MVKYHEQLYLSIKKDNQKPRVPNYIGEAILLICNRLAYKPNFINYTFREEMIADGIENCIMAVDNFNPDKSTNPFAYFTQIAWNAFLRRIAKERKQTYIKHKNFENSFAAHEMEMIFNDIHYYVQGTNEFSNEIITSFEEKNLTSKKKKKLSIGLEKLIDNGD